jgi:hypothetical protein
MFAHNDSNNNFQGGNIATAQRMQMQAPIGQPKGKQPMMRRLADVTNKLLPGRVQKDITVKRTQPVNHAGNASSNYGHFAIPQAMNMSKGNAHAQAEQQHSMAHGNPHHHMQQHAQQQQHVQQQQHFQQQQQQQAPHQHQQQHGMRQEDVSCAVRQEDMRIQVPMRQQPQPQIIRVQLTFSDIPPPREKKQKRTGKKRPVAMGYRPAMSEYAGNSVVFLEKKNDFTTTS